MIYAEDWYGNKIKEGDQLHPQRPIVEIPDLRIMQLKLKLGETAAQRCKEGQRAEISSFSFGGLILSGKVSKVNRIAKPIKRRSKVKKVEVLVELDSCGTTIVPGISARGKIFISKKEEFFAVPHECVFNKDSLKIIYIQNGGNFEPRAIKIDRQSEEYVLIRSGLKSGEDIAFQEPNEDDIDWPEHLSISVEEELKIDSSDTEIKRKKSIDSLKKEIVVSIP